MKPTKSTMMLTLLLCTLCRAPLLAAGQQRVNSVAQTTPETLVASLYKQHKRRSPFFQTRSRALLDQYFERRLGNLIWKDAVRSKGEVGRLDGDPLYNAQDMEIKNFVIHKATKANEQTEVVVSFENFDKKEQVVFLLVSTRNGWRIANLKYSDGSDLVGILSGNSAESEKTGEVKVYLVALGDNGKAGKKIGCDDSLVSVTRTVKTPTAPLKAALEELLLIPAESADNPKLHNFWKGRNLKLQSVSVRNQLATIHISGEVFVAGICDEPRIKSQIEETARQFANVKKINVFVGRRTLAEAIR